MRHDRELGLQQRASCQPAGESKVYRLSLILYLHDMKYSIRESGYQVVKHNTPEAFTGTPI
jgi:hypothetical protein